MENEFNRVGNLARSEFVVFPAMKSLRMVLGKMEDFVALSPAHDGSFLFASNFSFVTPLRGVRLADNSTNDYPGGNNNGPYNFNFRYNPTVVLIFFGLLAFLFFFGFCFAFFCRRTANGDGTTTGARNTVRGAASRGLERTVIESFPVFTYSMVKGLKGQTKGSECAVCLSDFEDEEMVRLLPKCSHAFHPECIDMWLCSHTTCPVCRTSLLPADDSNPAGTDIRVVEPQAPTEQIAIDISNEGATNMVPETSHDSRGHSLVSVQKESEKPTEWYIATADGLTPGLHRSCSFVAMHHSQMPSTSNSPPACSKADGSKNDEACRSRSERLGSISINPASFLRTFSERIVAQPAEQVGAEQQDGKTYFKKTLSWLMGGDRRSDRDESSQSGSRSSRHADQSSQL